MSAFTDAIERNLRGLEDVSVGAASGCSECLDCVDHDDEGWDVANGGFFSRYPCDSCGSMLGGWRYPAHCWRAKDARTMDNVVHLDVCGDCLAYHAYGEEPEGWREG